MRNSLFFAFSVAAIVSGCSSDPETTMDMGGTDVEPVKPALSSTQIERMGRATINVAVTNPFSLDLSAVNGGQNRDATRDKHSKDSNPATWAATWTPILTKTLAIYDGVDTVCGNQFGACAAGTGCGTTPVAANRYDVLAGTLADDQLYMDTSKNDCSFYLAVEASALGLGALAGTFCGGRTPLHDTVDYMYTAATKGTTGFPTGPGKPTFDINDGVNKDNEGTDSLTVFPFLSDPNP